MLPTVITPNTLLNNDSDPDGDLLTVKAVWGATKGTTALGADGTITYTPNAGETGIDTFSYLAYDGSLGTATTVTVTIAEINDVPVIGNVTTTPGTGGDGTVEVDATDPDGTPVEVAVTAVDAAHVEITPVAGQPGKFTVTITDGDWALSNPGKQIYATVTVTGEGSAPVTSTVAVGTVSNALVFGEIDGTTNVLPALPPGVTYVSAAAGRHNTFYLRSDGNVVVVSNNFGGVMSIPALPAGVTYTQVAGGEGFGMLLRSDGVVVAAGDGPFTGETIIPPLPAGVTYTKIATSPNGGTTLLLRSDGTVVAITAAIPAPPAGLTYTDFAPLGSSDVLLLSDGSAIGYGANSDGQLDIPPLPAGMTYTQVAADLGHTVLLRSDGNAFAFGANQNGQTDIPDLPDGVTYTRIAANENETVLLRSDGKVVFARTSPVIMDAPAGTTFTGIAAGGKAVVLFTAVDPSAQV